MKSAISRRHFVQRLGLLSAVSGAAVAVPTALANQFKDPGSRPEPSGNPDRKHVIKGTRGWTIRPTGVDDTENLQWALRNTPAGGTVKLKRGVFKIARPILVPDFDGKLVGAGPQYTTMTCTDQYNYELWEAPGGGRDRGYPPPPRFPRVSYKGSTTLTPPMLIQFFKTPLQKRERAGDRANRIEVRDLRCRGAMAGTPWALGDEVLCINIINSFDYNNPEVPQVTTRQDVFVKNVEVDGYRSPAFGPYENACACITVLGGVVATSNYNLEGDVDGDALGFANGGLLDVVPAEGDVTVTDCVYRNCRFGPGVFGYRDATILFENNSTDGCRANCLQFIDIGNSRVVVRDNDLHCDSFLLPPDLANGATDIPSSLGCVVVIQGVGAAVGYPYNVQWLKLASDPAAHAAHPEAGPLGTWRPQGPATAQAKSNVKIIDNACQSSESPNTYCFHVADANNLAFALPSVDVVVRDNSCEGSQTCISLEHINDAVVRRNNCSSQAFGIELHNAFNNRVAGNTYNFPLGSTGCEIRTLELGEKIDFSRVVPGAGVCTPQA